MLINKKISNIPFIPIALILFVSIITMGSSPLFQTNPWVDSNAMLTMGRSVIHGLVPYRDVIDQRGPFLYGLFALGAIFKGSSFLGVFILEVVNLLLVYGISFKIVNDINQELKFTQWIALLGPFALLSTSSFSFGGSPEEFAFTSILYLLYIINHYHQDVTQISLNSFFYLGINLSIIFWNKYSMIGAFGMFFLWTACVLMYKKQFVKLYRIIIYSLLGFLSVTIIFIVYFWINNALKDLIQIYFIQNITAYGNNNQTKLMQVWTLISLVAQEIQLHYIASSIIVMGWIRALYSRQNVTLEIIMMPTALVFVALQHWVINYYNIIWMPFFAIALIRLVTTKTIVQFNSNILPVRLIISFLLIIMPFVNNQDLKNLVVRNEPRSINGNQYVVQRHFSDKMKEERGNRPKILMINSLDSGFFLSTQTVPQTKYWHQLNMKYEQLPQMYQSFQHSMDKRQVDFVIMRLWQKPENHSGSLEKQINNTIDIHLRKSLFDNYKVAMVDKNSEKEYYVLMQSR